MYFFIFQGAKKDPKAGAKAPAKNPKKKEGGGGGKAKKKKWSKGKTRDKLNNLVLFYLSDHGFCFKAFATTITIGLMEGNIPFQFFFISFLASKNDSGSQRTNCCLVTAYDLHKTLLGCY